MDMDKRWTIFISCHHNCRFDEIQSIMSWRLHDQIIAPMLRDSVTQSWLQSRDTTCSGKPSLPLPALVSAGAKSQHSTINMIFLNSSNWSWRLQWPRVPAHQQCQQCQQASTHQDIYLDIYIIWALQHYSSALQNIFSRPDLMSSSFSGDKSRLHA